jgi:hypothetical protein
MFNSRIMPLQNKAGAAAGVKRKQRTRVDKRKRKFDRRKSVREGIIVNLSSQDDRRSGRDRRRTRS